MILKLFVTKKSNSTFSDQLEFNLFPIFIGRDSTNQVMLPDPLKIVSRRHAKILNTEGILQLVDLESANFTYLNDIKILSNEENALKSGDRVKIGDYELQVELRKEEEYQQDDDQKTMVFSSPYSEEISAITESLRLISSKYALDDSPAKEKMFRLALLQNLLSLEKNESNKVFASCFSENFLNGSSNIFDAVEEKKISLPDKRSFAQEESEAAFSRSKTHESKSLVQEYSFNIHFSNTIDVLLDIFTKLIDGFLQFRQEFFGVTKYYILPTGSLSEIKEFLFNPNISADEEKKRFDMLKDEAQKLLGHQIGLLEGYNQAVTEGSKMLLQSLDPNIIEKELMKKKSLFNKKARVLDSIKKYYLKYISDLHYIEKKFFRPSFMKGYQKRG